MIIIIKDKILSIKELLNDLIMTEYGRVLLNNKWYNNGSRIEDIINTTIYNYVNNLSQQDIINFGIENIDLVNDYIMEHGFEFCDNDIEVAFKGAYMTLIWNIIDTHLDDIIKGYILININRKTISVIEYNELLLWIDNQFGTDYGIYNLPLDEIENKIKELS